MPWIDVEEPFARPPKLPVAFGAVDDADLGGTDDEPVRLYRQEVQHRDLSRIRFGELSQCRLTGCKMAGADFGEAVLDDVEFVDCTFSMASLRMARLERVRFAGCLFDETDAYEAHFTDVDFGDSRLVSLEIDRVRAERVDVRQVSEIGVVAVGRLDGWLVEENQLHAMVYALAAGAGLGIERRDHQ